MGWLRSRAPSALRTRAPLNRVSGVGFDSSSLIARTCEFGDGVKSSTLARTVCEPVAVVSVWCEKADLELRHLQSEDPARARR